MALFGPARPPGLLVRLLRRLVDPRFYLKAVMGVGLLGLILVPSIADLVNMATKTAESDQGECRILNVVDGDTLTLMCAASGLGRARILGYDTPEKYAPKCSGEFFKAERASWALRTLIQRADRIEISHQGADQYGRALIVLTLDGLDVARAMIRAGHARTYGGGLRGSWC
ncbi:MAG: thermonuclease family protein [Tabrizicola sp.]|nr:thermonuclease family protein [Tabrizicola sp.]